MLIHTTDRSKLSFASPQQTVSTYRDISSVHKYLVEPAHKQLLQYIHSAAVANTDKSIQRLLAAKKKQKTKKH